MEEQRFKSFDIEVDHDENVPEPIVTGTVTSEYRQVLRHAPKWTTWPDFEQCRWLNDAIKWLWPGLNGAICKQVLTKTPIFVSNVCLYPASNLSRSASYSLCTGYSDTSSNRVHSAVATNTRFMYAVHKSIVERLYARMHVSLYV